MLLVVTSGKGGVGKSTLCVGLASAFARNGKSVLLVDTDEGMRCLDGMLGVSSDVMLDLSDAVKSPENYRDAVIGIDEINGLFLLPAPIDYGALEGSSLAVVLEFAENDFDCVIVDCPAGVDEKYYTSLPQTAKILVVTNSDNAAINGAMRIGMAVKRQGNCNVRLIVNRFSGKRVGHIHSNIDQIVDRTAIGLIGIVPEDKEIIKATAKGKSVQYGRGEMAFARIAARINGARILLPKSGRI